MVVVFVECVRFDALVVSLYLWKLADEVLEWVGTRLLSTGAKFVICI